jgi:hypothetical protein
MVHELYLSSSDEALLSLMGDGIKVVLTFIPEETLNILGFIPELLQAYGARN